MMRHTLAIARAVALTGILCASGCWTNVCIQHLEGEAGRCSEEEVNVFWDVIDAAGEATCEEGDATCQDGASDGGGSAYGEECTEYRSRTTCEQQGYRYQCGDEGYWYWDPCGDLTSPPSSTSSAG